MPAERLQRRLRCNDKKLASTLGLEYEELVDFCGNVKTGLSPAQGVSRLLK